MRINILEGLLDPDPLRVDQDTDPEREKQKLKILADKSIILPIFII